MKVKLAFQLLSRRMACAIKLDGKDVLSGLKRPLSDRNPGNQQRLESFIEWPEKWYGKKKGNKPPCFLGLPLTVRALVSIWK